MIRLLRRGGAWFDGLRGRIAAALVIALAIQFIGGDIIFAQIEAARMERGRAQRLADWLTFADEFAGTRPDATERMTRLWQPALIVSRSASPIPAAGQRADEIRIAGFVTEARPHLLDQDFRAVRDGNDLTGSIRLDASGGWLVFRAKDYFKERSQLEYYGASALLLLLCVGIIVLLFGRMIGRPLEEIAQAAEQVGRDAVVPIPASGPREVRQVAAAFDRMQARLLAQVEDRLQCMAAMSHDLRTPLARMRLNASTIDDGDTRAAFGQDVDEMEAFVSSVLEYLRGDEAEPHGPADLASIIMTVVDEECDAGEDVRYTGPHRLEAMTRPLTLKRLVRNVVQNATRHAGSAHVRMEQRDGAIRLVVEDDGPGIPEHLMEAVFEPFRRIETSRNRRTGGSGLGLAIARRLVTRLGGTIALVNRAESGVQAIISMPLIAIAQEALATSENALP